MKSLSLSVNPSKIFFRSITLVGFLLNTFVGIEQSLTHFKSHVKQIGLHMTTIRHNYTLPATSISYPPTKSEIFSAWRYTSCLNGIIYFAWRMICLLCCLYYDSTLRKSTYAYWAIQNWITTTSIKRLTDSVGCGNDINPKCRLHENLLLFFFWSWLLCQFDEVKLHKINCIALHSEANEAYGCDGKDGGSL